MKKVLCMLCLSGLIACSGTVSAQEIVQVSPGSLTGTGLITFDDVDLGEENGTIGGVKFESIYRSDGVSFGERFAGQSGTMDGNNIFEALSGTPLPPLSLTVEHPDENIGVYDFVTSPPVVALYGISSAQFQNVGTGSFAVLFDRDQTALSFELVGGNGSDPIAYIDFFRRDGSLIQRVTLQTSQNDMFNSLAGTYAFKLENGQAEVAGFSVHGTDALALGLDNLVYNAGEQETSVTNTVSIPMTAYASQRAEGLTRDESDSLEVAVEMAPSAVPEPGTMCLLGIGLLGMLGLRKRMKRS